MGKINLNNLFKISISLKLISGVFEIIGGLILLFVSNSSIANFLRRILSEELREDGNDFLVNMIINTAQNLSVNIKSFMGIYFILFGLINFWLAFIILTKRVKHYRFVEATLSVLIFYQVYKFIHSYSLIFLSLIFLDLLILILIFKHHKSLLNG